MQYWLIPALFAVFLVQPAYAQTIQVNATDPCFFNYTAGPDIFRNCYDGDYLTFALLGWEWITGGFWSMIFVSVFIFITYQKYHKVIYPIAIGIMFLPISYFAFPAVFISWAVVMAFTGLGIIVWYIFIKQTKDF